MSKHHGPTIRPRDIRRAFGPEAAKLLQEHEEAIVFFANLLTGRSFFGRLKWLLFGR